MKKYELHLVVSSIVVNHAFIELWALTGCVLGGYEAAFVIG